MNGTEPVRPMGNILDLWDRIMEPFEQEKEVSDIGEERNEGDNQGEEDDGENEDAVSVEEEEGAMVQIGKTERAPSKEEVAMHMVNHIPFRSWCSHCVKGKAHGNPHKRRKVREQEDREPIVSVDYMFMHDNQGESEE